MSTTIRLDGSDWAPESLRRPLVASLASAQVRAEQRRSAGPSALLGISAVACTADASSAQTMLRDDLALSTTRARASVKVGAALSDDHGASNTALGYLAGVKLSEAQQARLIAMLTGGSLPTGASPTVVSRAAVERAVVSNAVGRLARKAVKSDDRPSQAVLAVLLASCLDGPGARLSAPLLSSCMALTFMGPRRQSSIQRASDRLLAAAYATSGLSSVGIDLGSERWHGAPADWRFRAAPWLLPLLDATTSPALIQLLDAVRARGLTFVTPGTTPFGLPDSRDVTEYMRNVAVGQASALTKWTDWPVWFGGEPKGVQILLTQDETYAYVWVGRRDRGQLVAFDTTDFIGWGLDEQGTVQALAYAVGWYVDISVSLRATPAGTSTIKRAAGGSKAQGISYRPTPTYSGQHANVASGTHSPPKPHMRAAHVRDLGNENPSDEALSHAPAKYRSQLGPHDTWVRSASVGGAAAQKAMKVHLGKHSALADALGLMDRNNP
jgi:hypothetical protein